MKYGSKETVSLFLVLENVVQFLVGEDKAMAENNRNMGTVLVVEPDETERRALDLILTAIGGYVVTTCDTVTQALAGLRTTAFDLVITNTTIENINDGIGFIKLLCLQGNGAVPHHPAVLVVSQDKSSSTVRECIAIGAMHYVIRPYGARKLLESVEKIVSTASEFHNRASGSQGSAW